jgi:cytochrome b-561
MQGATSTALYAAHLSALLVMVLVVYWVTCVNAEDTAQQGFSWAYKSPLVFNWHPVLMVSGLVFCGTEAILIWQATYLERSHRKIGHIVLQTLALILSTVGLVAVFKNHNEAGFANMYSAHSWCGMTAIILYWCQYLGGLYHFMCPGVESDVKADYMPLHRYLGTFLFALILATTMMGLQEKMGFNKTGSKMGEEYRLTNTIVVFTIVLGISLPLAMMGGKKDPGAEGFVESVERATPVAASGGLC